MNEPLPLAPLHSGALTLPGIAHAFFTRAGGVSDGVYATLNGGVGSSDDPAAVAENRRRMAAALGIAPAHLMVPYQIHSADACTVKVPWTPEQRPRVDGVVTAVRGIGLGVTGADCGMVLFADMQAGVVGAAHAGWKGALGGVLETTIVAMERLGAARPAIVAILGPTIGPMSYEVGAEFRARFPAADFGHFVAGERAEHFLFDLPGYIVGRLHAAGLGEVHDLGLDTYADPARFYSYRRCVHRRDADYGRLVSAIALV